MQISCPACKTRISVPDERIKPTGTKVKCGKCTKIFTVKKKAAPNPDDLFDEPPPAAPSASDELGLGTSSAPIDLDDLGGDNFGAEMDNYKTQLRPMGGARNEDLFGSSEDLDPVKPPPSRETSRDELFGAPDKPAKPTPSVAAPNHKKDLDDLFGDESPAPEGDKGDDLDDLFGGAAAEPPRRSRSVMPPKEDLDDLFGAGLDADPVDDLAESLRESKPNAASASPSAELDDIFKAPESTVGRSENQEGFFDGDDAPPRPPAASPRPQPGGPSAEELAATLSLEPALTEQDLPPPPQPKAAQQVALKRAKREFPLRAVFTAFAGLAVAGFIAAAIFVPAVNRPVTTLLGRLPLERLEALFDPEPDVPIVEAPKLAATITGSRLLEGGRGDKLYVMEGEVRNDYAGARSFIKLKGILTDAEGKVIASREVFAGNLLNAEEIRGLDRVRIDGILNRSVGGGLTNFNLPAGKSIPFQIIFYDVEQPVHHQQVVPVGSEPGN